MSRKAQARPQVKELRKLYRGLQSTSIVQRIEVLKTALQWFDNALEYVKARTRAGKFAIPNMETVKSEDKMVKARRLGISSSTHRQSSESQVRAG